MKRYALIIPALLAVMFLSTAGNDSKKPIPEFPKFSTTVGLRIAGDEEILKEVYSYISRELRSLGDVQVVNEEANWFLSIDVRQPKNTLDRPLGFVLTTVVLETFTLGKCQTTKTLFEGRINETDCQLLEKLTDNTYWFRDHMFGCGSDLQEICQKTVTLFDVHFLIPDRERHQKLKKDILQELQKQHEKKGLTLREMIEKKKAEAKQKQ